jgi:hypothetical protein
MLSVQGIMKRSRWGGCLYVVPPNSEQRALKFPR